eukprot:4472718-Pleurochrysis_carterae.AAC.1
MRHHSGVRTKKCRQASNRVPRRGGARDVREVLGRCWCPAWDAQLVMRRPPPRPLAVASRAVERNRRRFVVQWP